MSKTAQTQTFHLHAANKSLYQALEDIVRLLSTRRHQDQVALKRI